MAEPIHLELAERGEGNHLLEALAVRGITGRLRRGGDRWEIEISYAHEETERLLGDVLTALNAWLDEHEGSSIGVRVRGRLHTFCGRESQSAGPGS